MGHRNLVTTDQESQRGQAPRKRLLKDDVVPHPALDVALGEKAEANEAKRRLDLVVFGVTAAIAIGFLIWGFVSTAPRGRLGRRAQRHHGVPRLAVRPDLLGRSWCSRSGSASAGYGDIPLGRDDEEPEFRTSRGSR